MRQIFFAILLVTYAMCSAQQVPGLDENIPYLINFGPKAKLSYGDDDNKQAFFFVLPSTYNKPFFIRVFDPEIGGKNDEIINAADTKMKYTLFGGKGIYSGTKGNNAPLVSETFSGDVLFDKTFDATSTYDDKWYSLGPVNPGEGEYVKEFDGYVFKVLAQGESGDDGNCYRYYLSSKSSENIAIPGANAFTYEYTVRLHDSNKEVSHLYPFVDSKVIKLKQHNFDLDGACSMQLFSKSKFGVKSVTSGDSNWQSSLHTVTKEEKESCMDVQIINNKTGVAKNNNVVLYITNQYGEYLPFMAVPIGDYTPKKKVSVKPVK